MRRQLVGSEIEKGERKQSNMVEIVVGGNFYSVPSRRRESLMRANVTDTYIELSLAILKELKLYNCKDKESRWQRCSSLVKLVVLLDAVVVVWASVRHLSFIPCVVQTSRCRFGARPSSTFAKIF